VLSDGHVYFTNEGKQRPSAEQALRYRFIAPALRPAAAGRGGTASTRAEPSEAAPAPALSPLAGVEEPKGLLGMFRRIQGRMQALEDEAVHIVRRLPPLVNASFSGQPRALARPRAPRASAPLRARVALTSSA
jgi:hypothetical protein